MSCEMAKQRQVGVASSFFAVCCLVVCSIPTHCVCLCLGSVRCLGLVIFAQPLVHRMFQMPGYMMHRNKEESCSDDVHATAICISVDLPSRIFHLYFYLLFIITVIKKSLSKDPRRSYHTIISLLPVSSSPSNCAVESASKELVETPRIGPLQYTRVPFFVKSYSISK